MILKIRNTCIIGPIGNILKLIHICYSNRINICSQIIEYGSLNFVDPLLAISTCLESCGQNKFSSREALGNCSSKIEVNYKCLYDCLLIILKIG